MPNHNTDLESLQNTINYHFKDISLLKNALTHSSYANEVVKRNIPHNERLEFLGDAVLELSSSEFLFEEYRNKTEGELTRLRASIVCEPTLALCARAFDLPSYIMLGKGEEHTGGRNLDSIISDACEALIGAIYLDGGFTSAKEFIQNYILNDLENKQLFFDSKTILQEVVQSRGKEVQYEMVREEGPDHNKTFIYSASCNDLFNVTAEGHTKKNAQQKAAFAALKYLKSKGIDINPKGKK